MSVTVLRPKAWRKPQVRVVQTTGPLRCCMLFRLEGGRVVLIPTTPEVTVTTDAVLNAIADAVGDRDFTVSELMKHSEVDQGLRDALDGMSRNKIGRLIADNPDRFERCGMQHRSARWMRVGV